MTIDKIRCDWAGDNALMRAYHDTEFGVPETNDQALFRLLVLELNQAGLSWQTIINKAAHFAVAYDDFSIEKVARYTPEKEAALLQDVGIIRNRRKIAAAVTNAQAILQLQKEWGSFSQYLWHFVDDKPLVNHWQTLAKVPAKTALSDAISQDLKKRGFKFVGSTIIYSFLQAAGLINDHLITCFRYEEVQKIVNK